MTSETLMPLIVAALAFVGSHFALSAWPLRRRIVGRIGEIPFRVLYSAVALFTFVWMSRAYARAPLIELWPRMDWAYYLALAAMAPAAILLVCAVLTPNPTAVIGARFLERDDPASGIFRVTRHPLMWAFTLWAAVHMLNVGDAASLIFFGAIGTLALGGMAHMDARRHREASAGWRRLVETSSFVPFVAACQGRTRISLREIGWWRITVGLVVFATLLYGHEWVIGIAVTPW